VLAIGVGIFAVLYAIGVYRREITARNERFKVPPKRTLVVAFAYAAWVFVLPGSPFNDFGWYTPTIGAIGGLVAAALIGLGILWFGEPEAATS
jgi:protein-S-isoprenylcysteine O-methyltransferase Ste14